MRKIISLLIAVSVFASVMTGCGTKTASTDDGLTVVHVWTGDGGGRAVWEELVDKFNKTTGKEKGIKIDWTTLAANSGEASPIAVAQQNGQLPEIFATSLEEVKKFAGTGDILPIEDFKGGAEFLQDYGQPGIEGRNMFDGKVYGVYVSSNVPGIIYNKDLFKKAGLVDANGEATPPKSFDEIISFAKKITDTKSGIYGYSFPLKFGTAYTLSAPLASSFKDGLAVIDYDNLTVDFSNWKYAWDWMLKMRDDGSLFPGAESLDNDTSRAYFAEGKIGMMPAMSWDVGVLTTQFVADCDWDVAPFPIYEGCEAAPVWRDLSGSYYLSKNAKKIDDEKVMEVYKFITSLDTRKAMYENGIRISCKKDVLEVADNSKIDKRFLKFAEILDERYEVKAMPSYALEGDSAEVVWQKVWADKMSVDDAIKDLTARSSEAFKKAVESGKIDVSIYK